MDQLNAAWSSLLSGGMERKHRLEDALLQLGQFHDALGELLMWIANSTARLKEAHPPGVEPGAVEAQIQDLEVSQSKWIVRLEKKFTSLIDILFHFIIIIIIIIIVIIIICVYVCVCIDYPVRRGISYT